MKKNYSTPSMLIVEIEAESIIAASITDTAQGATAKVGGTTESFSGEVDAASYRSNLWE